MDVWRGFYAVAELLVWLTGVHKTRQYKLQNVTEYAHSFRPIIKLLKANFSNSSKLFTMYWPHVHISMIRLPSSMFLLRQYCPHYNVIWGCGLRRLWVGGVNVEWSHSDDSKPSGYTPISRKRQAFCHVREMSTVSAHFTNWANVYIFIQKRGAPRKRSRCVTFFCRRHFVFIHIMFNFIRGMHAAFNHAICCSYQCTGHSG